MSRKTTFQMWGLFATILANFIAQIPYFLHLYATPQHPFPDLKSSLLMGSVLALFLAGYGLMQRRVKAGYYVLVFYLSVEFLFYLWNIAGGVVHGYGLFFHLGDRDPILWAVNAIGYVNFFAAGYFLLLLITKRHELA